MTDWIKPDFVRADCGLCTLKGRGPVISIYGYGPEGALVARGYLDLEEARKLAMAMAGKLGLTVTPNEEPHDDEG